MNIIDKEKLLQLSEKLICIFLLSLAGIFIIEKERVSSNLMFFSKFVQDIFPPFFLCLLLLISIICVLLMKVGRKNFFNYLNLFVHSDYRCIIFYTPLAILFLQKAFSTSILKGFLVFVVLQVIWEISYFKKLKDYFYHLFKKEEKTDINRPDFLTDTPITETTQDILGREDFVNAVEEIIRQLPPANNRLFLDGVWGDGKTSVLNLLEKHFLKERKEKIPFRRINPWHNDTKEKFLKALLFEINDFCQSGKNRFSLDTAPFLSLNSISLGFFSFATSQREDNIANLITDLSEKLKFKAEKRVFIIDDLDRLSRTHILDILSVIYMFSECPNLVFLMSGDISKIEKILTEEGENCAENRKNRKQYSYYSGYIDKIATSIIKLPAPHPYFIRDFFIKRLESIEKEKNIKFLKGNNLDKNFPNLNFKNLREAKKILVGFKNSFFQEKVQTEVDPFQFLLVSILSVSFPEVYYKIFQNERFWTADLYNKTAATKEDAFKQWDDYFSSLYSLYPDREELLKQIFIILNHGYVSFLYDKEKGSSYSTLAFLYENEHKIVLSTDKLFNTKNYFYRYFNHTLSQNTIPDKALDALWNKLEAEQNSDIAIENLQKFLIDNQKGFASFLAYISFHLETLDLKSLNYLPFAWKNLINQENSPFKEGELYSLFEKIKEIVKDKKIPSQTLLEIAFEVNSICYKIYLYHILLQENSEEAKELIGFLQKQNWNAKDVLSDCFYYKQSYYNFAAFYDWLRDFKYPAHYLEKRQADSIVVFKEDELIFWEAIGETLYRSTQGYSMNDTLNTWGKENIFDIIEQLLQQPDLTHRQELQEIKEYYKDWKPHTQDSN